MTKIPKFIFHCLFLLAAQSLALPNSLRSEESTTDLEILPGLVIANQSASRRVTLPIGEDQALYVSSDLGQAIIRFKFEANRAEYEGKAKIIGEDRKAKIIEIKGEVFENYEHSTTDSGELFATDRGSKLMVDAVVASFEWSAAVDMGYLYYHPESVTLYIVQGRYFSKAEFAEEVNSSRER